MAVSQRSSFQRFLLVLPFTGVGKAQETALDWNIVGPEGPTSEAVTIRCGTTVNAVNGAFVQYARLNAVKVETLILQ
jgi:hypothetical protein